MSYKRIELTEDELNALLPRIFADNRGSPEQWNALEPLTKLQAKIGVIGVIKVLQDMGFRIHRPMRVVGETHD